MKISKKQIIYVSAISIITIAFSFLIYVRAHFNYLPANPGIIETNKNLKIAIVGAGASGLTAAHTLKKIGYKNITVFEREPKAGGKVYSYEYNGHFYELGAVYFDSIYYQTLLDLIEDFKIDDADWNGPIGTFDMDGKWWFRRDMKETIAKVPVEFRADIQNYQDSKGLSARWSKFQLLIAYLNWKWLIFKHQRTMIDTPGFPSTISEMYINFKDFA